MDWRRSQDGQTDRARGRLIETERDEDRDGWRGSEENKETEGEKAETVRRERKRERNR